MVNNLFIDDDKAAHQARHRAELLDPACGTGGMLTEAQATCASITPQALALVYGQDYNPWAFAICGVRHADEGGGPERRPNNVRFGDIFTDDRFAAERFDYLLANPPFGVDWKKQKKRHRATSTRAASTTDASERAYPASTTARSCSCST